MEETKDKKRLLLKIRKEPLDQIRSGQKTYEYRRATERLLKQIKERIGNNDFNKQLDQPFTIRLENGYNAGMPFEEVDCIAVYDEDNEYKKLKDDEGFPLLALEVRLKD